MRHLKKTFKGLLLNIDNKHATFYIISSDKNNKFLSTYKPKLNKSIKLPEFKVKIDKDYDSFTNIQKVEKTSIDNLLNRVVEMTIYIKEYRFNNLGYSNYGWFMQLLEIYPIE